MSVRVVIGLMALAIGTTAGIFLPQCAREAALRSSEQQVRLPSAAEAIPGRDTPPSDVAAPPLQPRESTVEASGPDTPAAAPSQSEQAASAPHRTAIAAWDQALELFALDHPSARLQHHKLGTPIAPPWPAGYEVAMFGLGCFWGAERKFWETPGVYTTAVGYSAGHTRNPTYREVCSGSTGHNEVVLVVYDPAVVRYADLLKLFWEVHDPTQGNRQGNDVGTQYRSGVYWFCETQREFAEASRDMMQPRLRAAGYGSITTEIIQARTFYYAEG